MIGFFFFGFDVLISVVLVLAPRVGQALGVNAIELMPATTFGDQPNGWGYNPCAPYAVQVTRAARRLTAADLRAFCMMIAEFVLLTDRSTLGTLARIFFPRRRTAGTQC